MEKGGYNKLSHEKIVQLMDRLEVKSDKSGDVEIPDDSDASIYQPLSVRLDRTMGNDKEYIQDKTRRTKKII